MTLGELFQRVSENPVNVVFYFTVIPFAAALAAWLGKGEGHLSPWKYLYSALIYMVCVPGIFAVTLSVYLFLFERRSIFDTNIYTQLLPVLSMIVTLLLIRKNVDFDAIPGFGRISSLVTIVLATILIMWFVDRTHIVVFSYLRIEYVLLIFVGLFLLIRTAWSRMVA
jgi:hypothetical protein